MTRGATGGRPRAALVSAALALGMVATFAIVSNSRPWSPKRGFGLAFGTFAALAFGLALAYPLRRPRAGAARTAHRWLQVHLHLGILGFVAALVHSGFRLPVGAMGWGLAGLSALTVASGLLGAWVQRVIPRAMAEGLRVHANFERIPALLAELTKEADALLEGASDVLASFYAGEVRPGLARLDPAWAYVSDVRAGRERALLPLRQIVPFVEAAEKQLVDDLVSIYTEKLELDAQYRLQWVLRTWTLVHGVPGSLLAGLLVVHVVTWILY